MKGNTNREMVVFGNRVLCLVVLFLFQSAGWMGMAQGEPLISVGIKEHLVVKGTDVETQDVTLFNSREHCKSKGGYLASGYSSQERWLIMSAIHYKGVLNNLRFFLGTTMEDAVHGEKDPAKKCIYDRPSLNCVYKWNQGFWANALGDESGVGFYKGNDPSLKGAGIINNYDVAFNPSWPLTNRPYILSDKTSETKFSFYTIQSENMNPVLKKEESLIVCEIQSGSITYSSSTETTTHETQIITLARNYTPDKTTDHSVLSNGLTAVAVAVSILLTILVV